MVVSSLNTSVLAAVKLAVSHGYQIDPEALALIKDFAYDQEEHAKREPTLESIIILIIEEKARFNIGRPTKDSTNTITKGDLLSIEPDLFEKFEQRESESRAGVDKDIPVVDNTESNIEVISDPTSKIEPVGVEGFVELFKNRYEKLMKILRERPESRQLTRISDLKGDKVSRVAGLVYSKRATKNGIELVIDDSSGRLSTLVLSEVAKKQGNEVALDQCIMLEVESKGGRYFVKSVTQPDIPNRVASSSKKTVYAVFLSDLHVGSNKFLERAFARFLEWLSGRGIQAHDDEEIISHLKYVVIGGDIVDGVGVFPNQEYELLESNIYRQYEMVSRKLASIPKNLSVLVIPGNHDSTRQALPQPMIPRKYAEAMYNLTNVVMLGDPAFIKLSGVSVLVYHGRSLDDVLATTPGLSYEKPAEAMKVLLKGRHLAPMFGSRTPIAPELEDHLVISEVPDIFHAGHVHSVGVENYKGTTIINSGTWQAQTGYQANLGIMPRPGLVPIVNLATLEVTMREFLTTYESVV